MTTQSQFEKPDSALVPEAFDGIPYVVVVLNPGIFQYFLLPQEWDVRELLTFAVTQNLSNRLTVGLAIFPGKTWWFLPDGTQIPVDDLPRPQHACDGPIRSNRDIPASAELSQRQSRFSEFAERSFRRGRVPSVSPVSSLRPATDGDLETLGGHQSNGVPNGLEPCPDCGRWRGECLDEFWKGRVVRVNCACDNDSVCARCLEPLAAVKLDTCMFDTKTNRVKYVYPLMGTAHFCAPTAVPVAGCNTTDKANRW